MDLLGELYFPHGLSLGRDTAGTCLWQQIVGNSNIAVVLPPALPVQEPWKARAFPASQRGARHAGQHCREGEAETVQAAAITISFPQRVCEQQAQTLLGRPAPHHLLPFSE